MASNLEMEYQVFLCIFPMNFAMAKLGLKEMGKFLWKGREKVCPVSFKLKVTIAESFEKCKEKPGIPFNWISSQS